MLINYDYIHVYCKAITDLCMCVLYRYVDGESYMAAVADAILAARDEIFITDWM